MAVLSRSPAFRALLIARAVSLVGDGVGSLALVVHVQRTRGTGAAVGLLLFVAAAPRLLSPLAGTVADRFDRRVVLAVGELAQGLVLGIAVVWLPPLPVLLGLLLGKATVVTIAEPAGHSAVPQLVDGRDLVTANAWLGGLRHAGGVLGPLLGGLLVALGGVRTGLAVDAGTFMVSVPLLLRLPRMTPVGEPQRVGASAVAGLRYVFDNAVARSLTIAFFLVGLAAADDVALPFLARILGAGERGIGVLYAAVGAGLVLGYLALSRNKHDRSPAVGFALGVAAASAANALTGLAPALVAAVAFQMVRGLGLAVTEAMLQTAIQREVPSHLLGRVFANVYGAVNLGACLALLFGGSLLDATSPRFVLVASGAIGLLGAVAGARCASPTR